MPIPTGAMDREGLGEMLHCLLILAESDVDETTVIERRGFLC